MKLSDVERIALKDALLLKGPDAPTLCGEWTTRDLAVHLYVREQHPLSNLKAQLPFGGNASDDLTAKTAQRSFEEVVEEWAAGPKGMNPWRALDSIGNGMEHYIHHEDVLRGAAESSADVDVRPLLPEHKKQLLRILKLLAPRLVKSPRPVVLWPTGLPRIVLHEGRGVTAEGADVCRVSGEVGELLLWVSGRDIVKLTFDGNQEGITRGGF